MKFNLNSPSLRALSCLQAPSKKNEESDRTPILLSASSSANAMPDADSAEENAENRQDPALPSTSSSAPAAPGKHRPGWLQKTYGKCFAIEKPIPQWEPESLLVDPQRGSDLLGHLRLHKADVAKGGFGSISIFKSQKGEKLVGKFIYIEDNCSAEAAAKINEAFEQEFKAFERIHNFEEINKVKQHPNLVKVYGIANVPDKTGALKRAILMEAVPGPHGMKTFDALRKCWDSGKISTGEYWGAMQFLGRRLLDVTKHIGKAGVVHNDIKPQNFLVNEKTGEPVLIDLGSWSEPDKLIERGYTWHYAAPELRLAQAVSPKSDVFSVGASLLHGVEGGEIEEMKDAPNQGLRYVGSLSDVTRHILEEDDEDDVVYSSPSPAPSEEIKPHQDVDDEQDDEIDLLSIGASLLRDLGIESTQDAPDQNDPQEIGPPKDNEENVVRHRRTYSAKTAYSDFMDQVMQVDKSSRSDARKAKKHLFLRKPLLEDDAAKDVIKQALRLAKIEEKKPPEKQWKQPGSQHKTYDRLYKQAKKEIKELKGKNPDLHIYTSLQTHPKLRKYLDKNTLENLDQKIKEVVTTKANLYLEEAEWFAYAKSVLEEVPTVLDEKPAARVKSGVDRKGIRLQAESEDTDPRYTDAVAKARMKLLPPDNDMEAAPDIDIESLKRDVNDVEKFLYEVKISKIDNPEITEKIKQVREQATIARRVLELFEQGLSSSEDDTQLDKDAAKEAMEKAVLLAKSRMEKKNPWNRLKNVLMNFDHKPFKEVEKITPASGEDPNVSPENPG